MKIAVNASIMDGRPTGIGWYTVNMVNAIFRQVASCEHSYTLFSSEDRLFRYSGNVRLRRLSKYVRSHDFKKFGAAVRFFWNQCVYTRLAREFDICYSPTHHCSLFVPQIITVLDLIGLNFPTQHKLQYYYYRFFLPIAMKKARRIITISQATKTDIVKFMNCPNEKVQVITCGYDRNLYYQRLDAVQTVQDRYNLGDYILTVGATFPHKNLERLIESYSMLPMHLRRRYKLVVAGGENDYARRLRRLVAEKGLQESVYFAGYVSAHELSLLYGAATVMIYPSLYEGFGLPPLEAMACGCPVIISNTTSLPEVGGDAAWYVDPTDARSMSQGLETVLTDAALRDNLVQRGLARARLFSWDEAAEQLLQVFDEVGSCREVGE